MDFIKNCVKNMFRKKLRMILTISGIGIGVMSIVIISLIGEVGKQTLNTELNSMGIGGLCVSNADSGGGSLFGTSELDVVKTDASVEGATPLITKVAKISSRGVMSQAVVWGVDENATDIVSLKLRYGRMIGKGDVNSCEPVCVVDESFAQLFYKRDNIVGKTVSIDLKNQEVNFTVVGVVSSGGNILKGIMGNLVPTFLYVPYTTLTRYTDGEKFSQIIAKLEPTANEKSAEQNISAALNQELLGVGTVKIENLNTQKDKLNNILSIVTMILSAIGSISLLVAGLSIMTVMLMSVHERTREIGIKKSIGASRRIIMLEFLTEAFLLSVTGAVLGVIIGLLVGIAGCMIFGVALIINFAQLLKCILFSVGIGVLFGAYPAYKAANMKPVEALRCD